MSARARHIVRVMMILLLVDSAGPALAQLRPGPDMPEEVRRVFYEPLRLIGDDLSRIRIDVLYRIDRAFFVSFRDPDTTGVASFRRHGDLIIELLDSEGVSRSREIHRIDIVDRAPGRPGPVREWYTGVASLSVPPGRYTIVCEVDDLESQRQFLERDKIVEARAAGPDTIPDGDPFLITNIPTSGDQFCLPQNFGGDVLFGSPGALVFECDSPPSEGAVFHYTLALASAPPADGATPPLLDSVVTPRFFSGVLRARSATDGDTVRYEIGQGRAGATTVVVPLPLETLPLRSYRLQGRLLRGDSATGVTVNFRNVWPEMPFSLRDVDMALDALRYVTTPDQLDSLKRGPFEVRRDNLEAFWKPRDPDPRTAYNEVMTEYYRRVDHAVREFGTMREADGLRTDRGRIYILHGPPARVDRSLDPQAGFREVWTYSSPRKTFVFVDPNKSGTYVLVSPKKP